MPLAFAQRRTPRDLVATLHEQRWLIAGVALGTLALAAGYLWLASPVYENHVVVQVEDTTRTLAGLEQVSEMFSEKRPAETEIAIMRSQVLLGSVVDQLRLDIDVQRDRTLRDRVFRMGGDDRIRVSHLAVPEPLVDRAMALEVLDGGRFRVSAPDGGALLEGSVGERAAAETFGGRVEIFVADLVGPPGVQFVVRGRNRDDVVDRLRKRLHMGEVARGTGIIDVSLQGGDPRQVAAILNAFASAYVRQNVERKSAEAQKTLEFLDAQLPVVKANLDRAERALREFQARDGAVSLTGKAEAMLNRSVDIEQKLAELELQQTQLKNRLTDAHPDVVAVKKQVEQLRGVRGSIESALRALPASELESTRLARDQRVTSQLYDFMLNKAQELRVARSGIVGNVRILDKAREPRIPAWPKPVTVLALAVILGLGGGVAAGLVRGALDEGADDPEEIETHVGIPVYVTIPHSDFEQRQPRGRGVLRPLAVAAPNDVAVESLRSLRTALQFALIEARNNVIGIGSPAPGAGKSFVCVNLALLLAAEDCRVLLVDADLRRGRLHRYFSAPRQPGLSELLAGTVDLDGAIRRTDSPNLHLLSTGRIPPNPSELLATQRFQHVLEDASARYAYVLVDTPPVLAVTDPTLVARCTGVNLLVLRAGEHPLREISLSVKQYTQNGFPVQGAILNDARSTRHGYGRYGRYYEYSPDVH